ncbi:alpha/beta hydrolase [Streptomyces sp. GMY02]|uniref:alpha/beta hydrolase n=1 Tax=Streptomyces sp. GMY02 TaxID=1333528 RepID=UPI001C2BAC69|nr:alpha/beta hydrolase [Streptomyces sp. GMY02]QXE33993.1 alpha/beta hydrolase [Streptomyces sp. GMY02]
MMESSKKAQQATETATRSDRFRMERVTFGSHNATLVANLYLPSAAGVSEQLPAVIVTGAWGTVKEQMPVGYAREMAARGFIALAFDFSGWGESDGRPRSMEDPFAKAADIVAAAEYLRARPDVDASAIGGLGICASSAYMATAATRTDLITSLALVAPALPSRATVAEHLGGDQGVAALRNAAREALEEYEATGKERLVAAVDQTPEDTPTPEGADYYTNPDRGMVPEWDNTFNPASWTKWLEYDAQAAAAHLKQPLLTVHSDAAASPESVREFAAQVPREVEQLWIDEVSQFDFYDQPGPMNTACNAAVHHFVNTMGAKVA